MDKKEIKSLSKAQLIELLVEQESEIAQLSKPLDECGGAAQVGDECHEPVDAEFFRKKRKLSKRSLTIGILCALLVISTVVAVLVSYFPVYQVHGSSMSPLLTAGDTIVCMKGKNYGVGDIVAVEYQDMILIKRIVAGGGDRVVITEDGTLYINDNVVDEPYATIAWSDALCTAHVPQGKWYILGDNRAISGDSRLREIGSVSDEQIIGRVIFTVWPSDRAGTID